MKIKGIILTGGLGTRLKPFTLFTNKSALPLGRYPIIAYPLNMLIRSGINDIVVVLDPKFGEHVKILIKSLKIKQAHFTYITQPKPLGMTNAILQAKNIVKNSNIVVVAGDNVFSGNYRKYLKDFQEGEISFLRKVDNPSSFGIPIYDKTGRLVDIVEKPKNPKTNYAITGPHIFDNKVFSVIQNSKLSKRGEYEIADVHKYYLKYKQLKFYKVKDYWKDVGTFDSIIEAYSDLKKGKLK